MIRRVIIIFVLLLVLTALGPLVPNASAWKVLNYQTCHGYDPKTYACIGPSNDFTTLDQVWIHAEFDFSDIPKNVKFNSTSEWRDPTGKLYQHESYVWSGGSSRLISNRNLDLSGTDAAGNWTVSYIFDGGPFGHNLKVFTDKFTIRYVPFQIKVPIATMIPDQKNPFAPGTWGDATRTVFQWYQWDNKIPINKQPSVIYSKYTLNGTKPRLFFFIDAPFANDRTKKLAYVFDFDTENDGDHNFLFNPDDLFFSLWSTQKNQPPKFDGSWISAHANSSEALFSWDFAPSENSNQKHFKGYAEFNLGPLQKYPNPKDHSVMGFNAQVWQELSAYGTVTYADVAFLCKYDLEWPELVLTNTTAPSRWTTSNTLSTTSTLVVRTESTESTMTTQPNTVPINIASGLTGVNNTSSLLLGLVVAAVVIGSVVVYVRRRRRSTRPSRNES